MAVSCCCLLAKALERKGTVSNSGTRKAYTDNPGTQVIQHTMNDKGSGHSVTAQVIQVLSGIKDLQELSARSNCGLSHHFRLSSPSAFLPELLGCSASAADMLQK